MAFFKVALLLAVAAVAVMADDNPFLYRPPQPSRRYQRPSSSEESYRPPQPAPRYQRPASEEEESFEDAKYEFEWKVDEDDNNFGQQEQRDGDETQGSYYVNLPDGRRQTVTYSVDGDSGYVAEVKYSGEARHSEESSEEREAPRPSYQPPRSRYDD